MQGDWRIIAIAANGQPAAVAHRRDQDGVVRAFGIAVLDVTATGIARIVVFGDPGLVTLFGLPADRSATGSRCRGRKLQVGTADTSFTSRSSRPRRAAP